MFIVKLCIGAIVVWSLVVSGAAAADLPRDRLPDDYTEDGKPVWYPWLDPKPIARWEAEIGARYWYSSGRTKLDLYGIPPDALVSRLTYSGLTSHSGEVFGKAEHATGFFVKGMIGGGNVGGGNLKDEDFPNVAGVYSSTNSEQRDGRLRYGSVDVGYEWRSDQVRLGFFFGYQYYYERLNAYGCTQTASHPFICVPAIPSSVLAITQDTTWHAFRFGFSTDWRSRSGLRLTTEVAWLPFAALVATDTHWLRPDIIGPTPSVAARPSTSCLKQR